MWLGTLKCVYSVTCLALCNTIFSTNYGMYKYWALVSNMFGYEQYRDSWNLKHVKIIIEFTNFSLVGYECVGVVL